MLICLVPVLVISTHLSSYRLLISLMYYVSNACPPCHEIHGASWRLQSACLAVKLQRFTSQLCQALLYSLSLILYSLSFEFLWYFLLVFLILLFPGLGTEPSRCWKIQRLHWPFVLHRTKSKKPIRCSSQKLLYTQVCLVVKFPCQHMLCILLQTFSTVFLLWWSPFVVSFSFIDQSCFKTSLSSCILVFFVISNL